MNFTSRSSMTPDFVCHYSPVFQSSRFKNSVQRDLIFPFQLQTFCFEEKTGKNWIFFKVEKNDGPPLLQFVPIKSTTKVIV